MLSIRSSLAGLRGCNIAALAPVIARTYSATSSSSSSPTTPACDPLLLSPLNHHAIARAGILTVEANKTVYEMVRKLAENKVGSLLVTDDDNVVGVVTERDYIRKISLMGRRAFDTTVRDIMTSNPACVSPQCNIDDVIRSMIQVGSRHLPLVAGANGKAIPGLKRKDIIGMVSIRYIVQQIDELLQSGTFDRRKGVWAKSMVHILQDKGRLRPDSPHFVTIPEGSSVYEALQAMEANKIGALLVSGDDGITGIVTERDHVTKVVLKGKRSKATRVGEIMTPAPLFEVPPNTQLADAFRMVAHRRIRHLPVVFHMQDSYQQELRVVGVVSVRDLIATAHGN
eukprot:Opistho-2@19959